MGRWGGGEGGPCCPLTQSAPHMRSFRLEPACRQRPNKIGLRSHCTPGPADSVRPCPRKTLSAPSPPHTVHRQERQSDTGHTLHRHTGSCSSIRQTGPTQSDSNQTGRGAEPTGRCESGRGPPAPQLHLDVTFYDVTLCNKCRFIIINYTMATSKKCQNIDSAFFLVVDSCTPS